VRQTAKNLRQGAGSETPQVHGLFAALRIVVAVCRQPVKDAPQKDGLRRREFLDWLLIGSLA
jgi:hypothetical protein